MSLTCCTMSATRLRCLRLPTSPRSGRACWPRLTEESAPRRRRAHRIAGTRRRPRRIVIGGVTVAAAAAVAAGVLLAVQAPGGGSPTAPRAGSPVLPAHLTAVQVLDHAAHAALAGTAVPPRPGQFVYSKAGNGSRITQSWLSVDGSRDSRVSAAGPGSANEGGTQLGCEDGHRSYREPGYNGKPYHGPAKPKVIPPMDGPLVTETCTPELAYFPDMPTTERAMGPYLKQTRDLSPSDLNNLVKSIGEMLESDSTSACPARCPVRAPGLDSRPGRRAQRARHIRAARHRGRLVRPRRQGPAHLRQVGLQAARLHDRGRAGARSAATPC